MAASRNFFKTARLLSSLAQNPRPSSAAFLSGRAEGAGQLLPSAGSIFTRKDFYQRWFQTQTTLDGHQVKDDPLTVNATSLNTESSSTGAVEVEKMSNGSKPEVSTTSQLKISARHDMAMMFTCNVCETRSLKTLSKDSYEKGVVVARCGGCNNLHLIADRLGWFGEPGSVEDLLASRGEAVMRGSADTLNLTLEDLAGKNNIST
ncbi:DNL-type zinc finger protein [Linum grandiflorum]